MALSEASAQAMEMPIFQELGQGRRALGRNHTTIPESAAMAKPL